LTSRIECFSGRNGRRPRWRMYECSCCTCCVSYDRLSSRGVSYVVLEEPPESTTSWQFSVAYDHSISIPFVTPFHLQFPSIMTPSVLPTNRLVIFKPRVPQQRPFSYNSINFKSSIDAMFTKFWLLCHAQHARDKYLWVPPTSRKIIGLDFADFQHSGTPLKFVSFEIRCWCSHFFGFLFTSAKEVMFSSLFVCLSVYLLLATLRKNFRTDLHEILTEGWQ